MKVKDEIIKSEGAAEDETMFSLSRRLLTAVEADLAVEGLSAEEEWDLVTLRNALLKVKERT